MTGFSSVGEVVAAYELGQSEVQHFRKSPAQTTVAGVRFDLSTAPGSPVPNYYASSPLVAATLDARDGLRHGGDVAPLQKYLRRVQIDTATATALPLAFTLQDYLLYYPFVDMSTTDDQDMDNTVTLPRYEDGEGVRIMVVITNPPSAPTGLTFSCTYTNQDGVAGRVTQTSSFGIGTIAGSVATCDRTSSNNSHRGPYLPLQAGDTGVRSIEQFRMISGTDVGLVSLVLVKPLASFQLRGIDAPVEVDFIKDFMNPVRIIDGAYLNMIVNPMASLGGTQLLGLIEVVWG